MFGSSSQRGGAGSGGGGFKKASAMYSRSKEPNSAGPSLAPSLQANELAAAPASKAETRKEQPPVKRTSKSKQQPGSDIRSFFGGKSSGGGAPGASGPSVGEASGSGPDRVSGSGKARAVVLTGKEGAKASGSSGTTTELDPQVGSSYELESVVVGRQFHAPLPADLSGIPLSVEREPHNAVDPMALLVRRSDEPVGHLPARVAKVLSPLLDVDVISLGVSPLDPAAPPPLSAASPWPVKLHIMFLSDGSSHPETPMLMTLVGQQQKRKDKERAQEASKRQRLKFSQRSLLHNFGAKTQAATALVSGDSCSATLLIDMPDPVLQHIFLGGGLPTTEVLTSVRATCRRWKATVDTLHEQSLVWRVRVLQVCARREPGENIDSLSRPHPPSSPLPGSLPLLLSYVTERYPPLPRRPVRELCLHLGPPKWVEGLDIICSAFEASGEGAGWALLAMALLTAPSSTIRHTLTQHMLPPPGRRRLVEAPDFLAFLAMLIVLVATNGDQHEASMVEEDASRDPSDGSWSWLSSARWAGAWKGLREDLFIAYQRLETRAIDLWPKGLAKGGRALTAEQQDIVMSQDTRASDPHKTKSDGQGQEGDPSLLVVTAFAGTGKTTTLRAYAQARPDRKFLYLCFNVSVREEAQKTFPKNVQAKNIHQLAFGAVGYRYAKKLAADLKVTELADYLRLTLPSSSNKGKGKGQGSGLSHLVLAAQIIASLNAFFASPDPAPAIAHLAPAKPTANTEPLPAAEVLSLVEQAWRVMKDSNDTALPMTHAGYVKLYQLSRPDLSRAYDVIMLDEAQDVSPAIGDVIMRQNAPRVLCGDSHQAIYSFIGAQDYVRQAGGSASRRKHLSECFRFGTAIAEVANALLSTLKGETRRLIGLGGGRVVGSDAVLKEPWTLIARTNATLIAVCINLLSQEKRVAFVGGLEGYNLDALADVCHLSDNNKEAIVSNFVRRFQSIVTLTAYVTATDDVEWQSRLRLVQSHGSARLLELIAHLKQHHDAQAPTAHVLLSTVHKAKGLEFDRVALADDLVRLVRDEEEDLVIMDQDGHHVLIHPQRQGPDPEEVNMLYVAVTRCKKELRLNADLEAWLRQQGCRDRYTVTAVGPEEAPEPCDMCSRPALGSVVPIPGPPTPEQQAQQAAAARPARDTEKGPQVLVRREDGRPICHPCLSQRLPAVAALFLGRKVPPIPVVRAAPEAQVIMIDSDDEEEEQEEEED